MKFFEFKYIETSDGQIINQGGALYYTSAEKNIDEIKKLANDILRNPSAVVTIPLITEIDREQFIQKGGSPNIH